MPLRLMEKKPEALPCKEYIMKQLQLILDIASLVLSVVTIIYIVATWKKRPIVEKSTLVDELEETL